MAHRSFLQAIGAVQRQSGGARPAAAATVAPVAASQPASASHAQPLHVDLDSESEVIDLDNQLSLRLVYPVRLLVRLPGGRTAQRIDMWQLLQRLQQAVGVDNLVDGALKQAAPSAELDQLAYEGAFRSRGHLKNFSVEKDAESSDLSMLVLLHGLLPVSFFYLPFHHRFSYKLEQL